MSRKDTILVAVLVNAALLIALFVTALKSDPKESAPVTRRQIAEVKTIALPKPEVKEAKGDEVDRVLKEFSDKSSIAAAKESAKVDFAKELEALTKPKAPVAEKKANSPYLEVTVKKGDALSKIARAHGTTVNAIMELNNLRSTVLRIGQVLQVPKGSQTKAAPSGGQPSYYTVKAGDNPWTIAVKNQIKVETLLQLNGLNDESARRLKPGDQLRIR